MEYGKLTAKLRDAVAVCFIVEGKEIKRFKNMESPDKIKKLPYKNFRFDVSETMELACNVSGEIRKELVYAISSYSMLPAQYRKAPTYAHKVGEYIISKDGTVPGPINHKLIDILVREGFAAE